MKFCSEELWESLVRADDSATFFQTPAWHAFAQDFEGTQTTPLHLDLGDGAFAVLPLQSRRRWWGTLLSTPFGTYSSLLRANEITPSGYTEIADQLSRLNLNLPGSPFSSLHAPDSVATSFLRPPAHTHIVSLAELDLSDWVSRWSRNHRRLLKTAQDTGYTVRLSESATDIVAYCALYQTQARRWGSKARRVYPDELFQEAVHRFSANGSLRLWLAEGKDGIVAGRLCLYHGGHAVEWHAAAHADDMQKGVNHLLVHTIVSHARLAGYHVYDFNPNPGLEAVDHFKRGFATQTLVFEGLQHRTGLVGRLATWRDTLRTK